MLHAYPQTCMYELSQRQGKETRLPQMHLNIDSGQS